MNNFYAEKIRRDYPIGSRFCRLTVVSYIKSHQAWWLKCRCDCGRDKVVRFPNQMRRGIVRSCGCLSDETRGNTARSRAKPLPVGEAALRFLWRSYRDSAKRRGVVFSLSLSEFKILTSQVCCYCGAPPSSIVGKHYNGDYTYNGIDQREPGKGYTRRNSVSCCKVCNRAKFTMSEHEFKAWLSRAARHSSSFLLAAATEPTEHQNS